MEFKTVEQDVTPILKNDNAARCDDMALYTYYAYEKLNRAKADTTGGWLQRVFTDRRYRIIHGIAPYETVSRVRRKLQEKYAELRPSKEYQEERKRVEVEYKKYARQRGGGVNE